MQKRSSEEMIYYEANSKIFYYFLKIGMARWEERGVVI